MTTIDGAPLVDTPVDEITFKYPVKKDLPKDLTKTKDSCDNVLNLFQDAKHNRDLIDKTINLVTDGKNILSEIIDGSPDSSDFQDSPIFRKFNDCISRLETFNQSNSTDEVRQGISKLNDELEASIDGLRKLLDGWNSGYERTRWNGKVKKKFKALGKMVSLRKSILPPERGFSNYDVSEMVEPINPPVSCGSRKHITKGLYAYSTYVALKKIGNFEKGDPKLVELTKEMDFIKSLECQNILEIYGLHRQGIQYNVVSRWEEYNLQAYLLGDQNIDWTKKLIISRGIANALNFLHKKGVLHYDISSHNIYLNSYFEAKLHNFRIVKDSPIILTSANELSNPRWIPPEIFRGEGYTEASDIYSFSLVLWEIVNQQIPYHDTSPDDIKNQVLTGTHPQPKETNGTPIDFQDMMEKGWNLFPDQRPTIQEMFDVLAKLEIAQKTCRRMSRIGDNTSNTSSNTNSFLSPSSAIRDGKDDDASSITSFNSVGSVDFVSPAGYNVTTHLGKRKGIDKFNPFQKSTVDFDEAVQLHRKGSHDQAWKILKEVKKRAQTPDANFWVGYYHVKGFHGKSNPGLGVEHLWQAAKEDHSDAQYHYANAILNLGQVAKEHRNEKRFKVAMDLLEKAAKQDHPLALKKLGSIRRRGLYGKELDVNAGKDLIKRGRAMTSQDDRPRSSFYEARPTNRLSRHNSTAK